MLLPALPVIALLPALPVPLMFEMPRSRRSTAPVLSVTLAEELISLPFTRATLAFRIPGSTIADTGVAIPPPENVTVERSRRRGFCDRKAADVAADGGCAGFHTDGHVLHGLAEAVEMI